MMLGKGVYNQENQSIDCEFQHMLKADLILVANTPIYVYHIKHVTTKWIPANFKKRPI